MNPQQQGQPVAQGTIPTIPQHGMPGPDIPSNQVNRLPTSMPLNAPTSMPMHMPDYMSKQSQPDDQDNGSNDMGHKKVLLQKLMGNLLSKPGRSMHEMINGVKDALGAYKNYAKEWDSLSGAVGNAVSGAVKTGANGIQDVMRSIQQQKQSSQDGAGGPGFGNHQPMGNPNGMPTQAHGTPSLGNPSAQGNSFPPSPQPAPPQSMQPQQTMNQQSPGMSPMPSMGSMPNQQSSGMPPMGSMPNLPPIVGQPQTSTFNRPAPVSSLGIWGH